MTSPHDPVPFEPGGPPDSLGLLTAALRGDAADLEVYARVLTGTLAKALPPGSVAVQRRRSMADRLAGRRTVTGGAGTPGTRRVGPPLRPLSVAAATVCPVNADRPGGGADEVARCRRAALDHVLRVIADAPWSGSLVLRGSMVMPAWVGAGAREPGDLDWVVLESAVGVDALDPYPYVDRLDIVQQWPEAADGAARYEIWADEEFGTGGQRPVLPPEGLHWLADEDTVETGPPYLDLLERLARHPEAAPGLVLDADKARVDGTWTYAYHDTPGVRLVVPWHAEGLPSGEVRLDFARDEQLPEAPVWTLVPRGDGGQPVPVRTVSRELSLTWKLLWLHTDSRDGGRAQGKDLYDAVLLAEGQGARLPQRLLRGVFRRAAVPAGPDALDPAAVLGWDVDWAAFRERYPDVRGAAEEWLRRLVRALAPLGK
ncbi:nucleotidyl transferase AbiEii/AbiGii toxin family protein [Streptomyces sp. NPDC020192]|uniref:nucleotidyl transferase AbiEii/AbiGii toxin family protein n=1 Tax=Streptomyces sp. NPDC020192 TaxID=3365066 RepID=UPI0037BA235C